MRKCKKVSSTFTWPCVNVLRHVKLNVYIILLVHSILIRCGCILIWVLHKTQCFYYNRPLWPFVSNYNVINVPQVKVLLATLYYGNDFALSLVRTYTFGQRMGQIVVLLENFGCICLITCCPMSLLE